MGKVWKRYFLTGMCFVLLLSLTSCGKKKVDYVEPDSESGQTSDGADPESSIPEHVNETITADSGDSYIEIDADVIMKEDSYPVATLASTPFSEEDMTFYSEHIFDAGTAELWQDTGFLTQDSLLARQEELEAELNSFYTEAELEAYNEKETVDYTGDEWLYNRLLYEKELVDSELTGYEQTENRLVREKPEYLYFTYSDPFGNEIAEGSCMFRGCIDGENGYSLYFHKYQDYTSMTLENWRYPSGSYLFFAPESPVMKNGNSCKYSMEEAEEMAYDFLEKMGIEDFAALQILDAKISLAGEETEEIQPDTYCIFFERSIDGKTTLFENSNLGDGTIDESGNMILPQETITVMIGNDGIARVEYRSPMQVEEITTEQADLLPFDKIQERAREYFKEICLSSETSYIAAINTIELGLERVSGEDGSYMLVPAWIYSEEDKESLTYEKYTFFAINAIDGSYIELY